MPYRLRVKFPGGSTQAPRTLLADPRTFPFTGRDAILIRRSPTPSTDTWVKVSQDFANTDPRSGPHNPFHHGATYSPVTDEIYVSWRTPTNNNTIVLNRWGTMAYSVAGNQWRQTNQIIGGIDSNGNIRALGQRENRGECFVPGTNTIWYSAGSPSGTYDGVVYYDPVTDIFTPAPGNPNLGIENGRVSMGFHNGRIYSWKAGFFKYWNIATQTTTNLPFTAGWPMDLGGNEDLELNIQARGGINRTGNYLWGIDADCNFWKADLSVDPPTWQKFITTGNNRPHSDTLIPSGVVCCIDEDKDYLVAFTGGAWENGAYSNLQRQLSKTWLLDLQTYEWRNGPQDINGDVVPKGTSGQISGGTTLRMVYDSNRKNVLLTYPDGNRCSVWAFYPTPRQSVLTWTGFPVPTSSGSTYGVNYVGFPFVTNAGSKNINLGYCPLNNRVYASGGDCGSDSPDSNTPGIWSMSLTDGTWRLDSGYRASGGNWIYPQPNGFQDGSMLEWSERHQRMLFGLSPGESYVNPGDGLAWQYAQGFWLFNPALYPNPDAWTQDMTLAPSNWQTVDTQGPSLGGDYGGVYDEESDTVYLPNASATGLVRLHVGTMTRPANLAISVPSGGLGKSFNRSKPTLLGRFLYQLGTFSDGTPSGRVGKMIKCNIDTGATTVYNIPSVTTLPATVNLRLENCSGKIVWLNIDSVGTGNVLDFYLFDPVTETWTAETSRPTGGTFTPNASCSLPNGQGVVFTGGGFGNRPTHVWIYRAP